MPNTDDVEFLLETLRDALDGVGYQRARQAVHRAILFALADSDQHAIVLLEVDARRQLHTQLDLWPLHLDRASGDLHFHARWYQDRFPSNSRHIYLSYLSPALPAYQTSQSTSPPTRALRAERPVITPRDRKSTRLNSSHGYISYAVFCL